MDLTITDLSVSEVGLFTRRAEQCHREWVSDETRVDIAATSADTGIPVDVLAQAHYFTWLLDLGETEIRRWENSGRRANPYRPRRKHRRTSS